MKTRMCLIDGKEEVDFIVNLNAESTFSDKKKGAPSMRALLDTKYEFNEM